MPIGPRIGGPAGGAAAPAGRRFVLMPPPPASSVCEVTISAYVGQRRDELVVRALADELAAVEHEDLVRVANARDALRDDDHRRVCASRGASAARSRASVARSSAENESSNRSTRRARAAARARSRAAGAGRPRRSCRPARSAPRASAASPRRSPCACASSSARPQLLVGGVGVAEPQVRRDRAREQIRALRHHADPRPQLLGIALADVDAVDEHGARRRIGEPRDQLEQRRLARRRSSR